MIITDIHDLQPGDIATFNHRGHVFIGEVWKRELGGALLVGPVLIKSASGETNNPEYLTFVSAVRPAPTSDSASSISASSKEN